MAKPVPPREQLAYAEFDRLREEIESFQREIGAGAADHDEVEPDSGVGL